MLSNSSKVRFVAFLAHLSSASCNSGSSYSLAIWLQISTTFSFLITSVPSENKSNILLKPSGVSLSSNLSLISSMNWKKETPPFLAFSSVSNPAMISKRTGFFCSYPKLIKDSLMSDISAKPV